MIRKNLFYITLISVLLESSQVIAQQKQVEPSFPTYPNSFFQREIDFKFYASFSTLIHTERLDTIDGNSQAYGLFLVQNKNGYEAFKLEKFNVKIVSEITPIGSSKETFYTDSRKSPLYIFKGLTLRQSYLIKGKNISRRQVFPGEYYNLSLDDRNYLLYALGELIVKEEANVSLPIEKIENFELRIREKGKEISIDSALCKLNIQRWPAGGYEESCGIYWIGDLDADGQLDMILGYSNHYSTYEYRLYLSTESKFDPTARQILGE